MKKYFVGMTIAGSDSGGGAGIQADLKTFSELHVYGCSVITALTAQSTHSVTGILETPPEFIRLQLETVSEDIEVAAIKTGMLHSGEVIATVSEFLAKAKSPVVVDPVMVSKSGDQLLRDDAVSALRMMLLPQATIVTPNIPEAEELLVRTIDSDSAILEAARDLCKLGPEWVVLKGGHGEGSESRDCVVHRDGLHFWLSAPRISSQNTHGTGCTFSAAICAYLARGESAESAIRKGKEFITNAINCGRDFQLGHGTGPVKHFGITTHS